MVVKIRFGRGLVVARRKGKNSRLALLGSGFLTLVSICLGALGLWRMLQDVGLPGDFIFREGILSHWQVWIGSAALSWWACLKLSHYAKRAREVVPAHADAEADPASDDDAPARLAANM